MPTIADRLKKAFCRLVDAIPSYAGPAELDRQGGRVSDAEVARGVAEGRVGIEVKLEQAG
jgi:hypothetical protein